MFTIILCSFLWFTAIFYHKNFIKLCFDNFTLTILNSNCQWFCFFLYFFHNFCIIFFFFIFLFNSHTLTHSFVTVCWYWSFIWWKKLYMRMCWWCCFWCLFLHLLCVCNPLVLSLPTIFFLFFCSFFSITHTTLVSGVKWEEKKLSMTPPCFDI